MVYVDYSFKLESINPKALRVGKRHGHKWCHMWADDVEELKKFALSIGIKQEWLQNKRGFPHFDIVPTKRLRAIANGAQEMPLKEWIKKDIYNKQFHCS
ncbi:MAG: DUF4031 domain-containing protein [Bacteroidetes bacterium]|nr:DUF4031 domain-containing protein [Bacteroidota bacterium]